MTDVQMTADMEALMARLVQTERALLHTRQQFAAVPKVSAPLVDTRTIGKAPTFTGAHKDCELAKKTTQQLYKVSSPCIDDHQVKKEELKSMGELSDVCSQMVLKCLKMALSGRLDILWSGKTPARAITKWTKDCDKRLARLISYIHFTSEYKQLLSCGKHSSTMAFGTVSRL